MSEPRTERPVRRLAAAVGASLGGTFSVDNLTRWDTAVQVVTAAATDVMSTGATLHGSVTVGAVTMVTGFEYGTSPTVASPGSTTASPATVNNQTGAAVETTLTDLIPATTDYFRATGTTNLGTETEGVLSRSATTAPRGRVAGHATPKSSRKGASVWSPAWNRRRRSTAPSRLPSASDRRSGRWNGSARSACGRSRSGRWRRPGGPTR